MYYLPKDLEQVTPNVFRKACPARYLLQAISGKWSLLIIDLLGDQRLRNAEIMRMVEGISQRMLTLTLRELEALHLVRRHDMQSVPPHVEYELTDLGKDLHKAICSLDRWIEENMLELIADNENIQYV